MVREIVIENFRCFSSQKLSGLQRINVLVGPNGSGKTALLEAVFFVCGLSPELALRVKSFRGLSALSVMQNKEGYESLWKDLFHLFEQNREIKIFLKMDDHAERALHISYQEEVEQILAVGNIGKSPDTMTAITPISFVWKLQPENKVVPIIPEIHPEGLKFRPSEPFAALPGAFFAHTNTVPPEELAKFFSGLSKRNEETEFIQSIQSVYPEIEDLSIQFFSGMPALFASVKELPEKIPVNLLSAGITKLLTILLGLATHRNGIVCIDEIENGFYYETMPKIWSIIHLFARKYNVQIFASTHSWECLQAASEWVERVPEDFTLIQILAPNRHKSIAMHSGNAFVSAMAHHLDVR
ncbi:MAG: AAA family ATPase [Magnetococcales bacterium]|nr:AAA family ATPase [Magnetococcales bacterium]MBF0116379.1 AAA family ATPase [Magnetococcales bacterium]